MSANDGRTFHQTAFPEIIREDNKLRPYNRAAHDWYRFVLSFPPHLVRTYLEKFGVTSRERVLDGFCGTGTTIVECKKLGIGSVGIEANPLAAFAARVKVDWSVDPEGLLAHAVRVAEITRERISSNHEKLRILPQQALDLLLENSISPVPLHKTLLLMETLGAYKDERFDAHERLAVAKSLVSGIGNLNFGPEVGVGPIKRDAQVLELWLDAVRQMAADLKQLAPLSATAARVIDGDARYPLCTLEPDSINAVITSPPYPNEKDYTRTTRLEAVLLGFLNNRQDLRGLKQALVRSNTRNVYKTDRDDLLVVENEKVQAIAEEIEKRRVELGKTSGFERLYAKVTKLYFGGMAQHLSQLRGVLRSGARLAFIVGDQASYLRVMIRTGTLLAEIAESLGYEVTGIDLFRTRLATATKAQLREEVLLLRWPGFKSLPQGACVRETAAYSRIIESIFRAKFVKGSRQVDFDRQDIIAHAERLGVERPDNLGDVVYTFRYRKDLPESIRQKAGEGESWIIRGTGRSKCRLALVEALPIVPNEQLAITKVPDSTPQIILKHALTAEQALLSIIRYTRLIDIFTRTTCYSLQNHLVSHVSSIGQMETDEVYLGIDQRGAQYVYPLEAKGSKDKIGIVQIEQNMAMCEERFPNLICRPLAAQFMEDDVIALFLFEPAAGELPKIEVEKHYKLVPHDQLSEAELRSYGLR